MKNVYLKFPLTLSKHLLVNVVVSFVVMGLGHLIFSTLA